MRRRPGGDGIKPVTLAPVINRDIPTEIVMTGPLYAYHKVEIYAEVSGVLMNTPVHFREGVRYRTGDLILRIDDRVFRNNVMAQKSSLLNQLTLLLPDLSIDFPESAGKWEAYLADFDMDASLAPLPQPANPQEQYYIASRNIYSQYYTVKAQEETLAKYTLEAPFNGVVTEANINPGTLVRIGQKLGEFTGTDLFEMEASVSHHEADRLRTGQAVTLASEDVRGSFRGTIQRINNVIDRASMTVKVYIQTRDQGLKDGMYMTARAESLPFRHVFTVAKDLMTDGEQIYTVQDSILHLTRVSVVAELGDRVIVRGLEDGTLILGEPWADAREGAKLPPATRMAQEEKQEPDGTEDASNRSDAL